MDMKYCYFESPVGRLLLAGHELLESLHFPMGRTRIEPGKDWQYSREKFKQALDQLEAYFKGERRTFDLQLNLFLVTLSISSLNHPFVVLLSWVPVYNTQFFI